MVSLVCFVSVRGSQVQHAVLDLLGAALVPELGADVAAGTAGYVSLFWSRLWHLGHSQTSLPSSSTMLISPS